MAGYQLFEELARDVGFTADDGRRLAAASVLVEPEITRVVDAFYRVLLANPRTRSVFTDDAQIERQKRHLTGWIAALFTGVYDDAWFERRLRVGATHVRIRLDQRYMVSMIGVLRSELSQSITNGGAEAGWDGAELARTIDGLERLMDLELAIMLESYQENFMARLSVAERLGTLGQVAATIGHELRNPLAVISSSVHLLERRVEDPKVKKHLDRIEGQVALSNRIVTDLLEMARDRPPRTAPTTLDQVLAEAVAGVRGLEETVVDTELEVSAVELDGGQFRQLFVNLIQNAAQAGATRVVVRARGGDDGELLVEVEDDGPGMDAETRAQAFDPLFTTRLRGVGLGLALCRRVVEKHGGTIAVDAGAADGALFSILIPGVVRSL